MAARKRSSKLSRDEAEEFSRNLGNVAVGTYGIIDQAVTLGVPDALGMTAEEWVQDKLGGYVQRSREQLREEVAALVEAGRTNAQISGTLGISKATISNTRAEISAREALEPGDTEGIPAPLTFEERRAAVGDLMDEGKSAAEIAVALDASTGTIKKDIQAIRKEREPGPSKDYEAARDAEREKEASKTDAERTREAKESEALGAAIEEPVNRMTAGITVSNVISAMNEAREDLAKLIEFGLEPKDARRIDKALDALNAEFDVAWAAAGLDPR